MIQADVGEQNNTEMTVWFDKEIIPDALLWDQCYERISVWRSRDVGNRKFAMLFPKFRLIPPETTAIRLRLSHARRELFGLATLLSNT